VLSRGGGGRHVVMYAYRVRSVLPMTIRGEPRRALLAERLDVLAVSFPVWGLARPHLRDALVLVDELDASIAELILPALDSGADLRLCDLDAYLAESPWSRTISRCAGEHARRELMGLLGDEAHAVESVSVTVRLRLGQVALLRDRALLAGKLVPEPRGLTTPRWFLDALAGMGFDDDLVRLQVLDSLLERLDAADVLASIRGPLALRVALHEGQHLADNLRDQPLPLPPPLEALTGPLTTSSGLERREVVRARDELSAYLGSLARETELPHLMLALVVRPLLDAESWGSPEAAAALVILDGLALQLGVPHPPLLVDGHLDRAGIVDCYVTLTELEPERVQRAAQRLWQHLFGAALVDVRVAAAAP
jgi:hypothetical protein